ncbi:Putative clathrin assembly protein At5g35200 [Linum grandiflorum]
MANGSGSQKKIRQAIGALKDTTKVGLVKVNSEYKGIDIAIVKATSHDVVLPKEKHIKTRDYSVWIRAYALYLEERLECYRVMKYDINRDPSVGCEASSLYIGISNGIMNLVDKFFEMRLGDASKALDIYKRAANQASKLSELFEICRAYDVNHDLRFAKIEQAPASFLTAMEDYVKQNSSSQTRLRNDGDDDDKAISRKSLDFTTKPVSPVVPVDLFDLDPNVMDVTTNPSQGKSKTNVKTNSMEDEVIKFETSFFEIPPRNFDEENNSINNFATSQATSWELALVTAFSSDDEVLNPNPVILNDTPIISGSDKEELDKVILEGLYEEASANKSNQSSAYNMNSGEDVNPFGGTMNQDLSFDGNNITTSSMECVGNPFIDSSHYMVPSYHHVHVPLPQTSFSVFM